MRPTFHHDLAQARVADLHRNVGQGRLAHAASRAWRADRARPPQSRQAVPALPAFGRRMLAMLGSRARRAPIPSNGRSPSPTR